MIINNNISAANATRVLGIRDYSLSNSIQKLSTGQRINTGADDAAGLGVSEKMRGQIKGLLQASNNASDAISFIQATEGYLQETHEILNRLRELSIQAGNGIYASEDRMMLQVEVSQLVAEIDRVASHAQFNGLNMLTGRFARQDGLAGEFSAGSMIFHIGANSNQRVQTFIGTMTATALNLKGITLSTPTSANQSLSNIDEAIAKVTIQRSSLGSFQNRLEKLVKGSISRQKICKQLKVVFVMLI